MAFRAMNGLSKTSASCMGSRQTAVTLARCGGLRRCQRSLDSTCSRAQAAAYTAQPEQEPDRVNGMISSCMTVAARMADTAVSRLADALQVVAPPDAPRDKVEVSVKGALLLLLLGLLKGVISFVLCIGCVGLVLYTATQVFGWNALLLSRTGMMSSGRDGPLPYEQAYQPGPPPGSHATHQRPPGPQGHPPPWMGQGPGTHPAAPQPDWLWQQQGDLADVYRSGGRAV